MTPEIQKSPLVCPTAFSSYELTLLQQFSDKYFVYVPENVRRIMNDLHASIENDQDSKSFFRYLKYGMRIAPRKTAEKMIPRILDAAKAKKEVISAEEFNVLMGTLVAYQRSFDHAIICFTGNDAEYVICGKSSLFCGILAKYLKTNNGNLPHIDLIAEEIAQEQQLLTEKIESDKKIIIKLKAIENSINWGLIDGSEGKIIKGSGELEVQKIDTGIYLISCDIPFSSSHAMVVLPTIMVFPLNDKNAEVIIQKIITDGEKCMVTVCTFTNHIPTNHDFEFMIMNTKKDKLIQSVNL